MTPEEVIGDLVIGIDHIGLAVKNLDESIQKWQKIYGAQLHSREINLDQEVEEALLVFPNKSQIQLLSSLHPNSPIGKFIEKHGEGIQQLAIQVTDIAKATQKLNQSGIPTVYPAHRKGSNGSSINFIHPKFTGGVLLELVEY